MEVGELEVCRWAMPETFDLRFGVRCEGLAAGN
jgi:hypothetical protein